MCLRVRVHSLAHIYIEAHPSLNKATPVHCAIRCPTSLNGSLSLAAFTPSAIFRHNALEVEYLGKATDDWTSHRPRCRMTFGAATSWLRVAAREQAAGHSSWRPPRREF